MSVQWDDPMPNVTRRSLVAMSLAALVAHPTRAAVSDDILRHINDYRISTGLEPVSVEPRLTRAAVGLAKAMIQTDKMSHTADGLTLGERVARVGYRYRRVSENIAWITSRNGDNLGARMVKLWIDSPPHRANLSDPSVTQAGIGVAKSGTDFAAAQIFGKPAQ